MDAATLDLRRSVTSEAAAHARCGPHARCLRYHIADVDALVDTIRGMDLPNVPDAPPSPITG